MMSFQDQLNRWFNPWKRRILLMVGKAIITAAKNSTINTANVDLMADEKNTDLEMIQTYGFTSMPIAGTEAVVVSIGGDRSNMLIIATGSGEKKPDLNEGESAQHNDKGNYIKLTKAETAAFKTGVYHTHLDHFINLFLSHTHLSGAPGSPTSPVSAAPVPILPIDFKGGDI